MAGDLAIVNANGRRNDRPFYGHSGGCCVLESMSHNKGYVAFHYVVVIMVYVFYALLCGLVHAKMSICSGAQCFTDELDGWAFCHTTPSKWPTFTPKTATISAPSRMYERIRARMVYIKSTLLEIYKYKIHQYTPRSLFMKYAVCSIRLHTVQGVTVGYISTMV